MAACPFPTKPRVDRALYRARTEELDLLRIDEGGRRAAAIYTLIETAKLNDIDPQAWLADVLARLPDHPAKRIDQLLPWNWRPQNLAAQAGGRSRRSTKSAITCGLHRTRTIEQVAVVLLH